MSFTSRASRLKQEIRRSGRIETPIVFINDPDEDLDAGRTIEIGRPRPGGELQTGLNGSRDSPTRRSAAIRRRSRRRTKTKGRSAVGGRDLSSRADRRRDGSDSEARFPL
jgi:hypothetical protein